MKVGKKLAALCLGATLALGSAFGLAACGESGTTGDAGDPDIRAVYDMYVENCAASNTTPQTYEEWLASIKGAKGDPGDDGITPHIDPETGNWFIGDEDTHIKAAGTNGTNGVTPHIDPKTGRWFIGDEDTGISATGPQGQQGSKGDPGKDGNGWLYGNTAPDDKDGEDGDLYLNYTDWTVYTKENGHWTPRGSIKGEKGDPGDNGNQGGETDPAPSEKVVKDYGSVTIAGNESQQLDLTDVESGYYWLVAETETTAAAGILRAESTVTFKLNSRTMSSTSSYDLYSSKSTHFKGIVAVDSDTSKQKVTLYNKSASSVTAKLKLVEYTPTTLTLEEEFEIPCFAAVTLNGVAGRAPVLFDKDTMSGKDLKITVVYTPNSSAQQLSLRYNSVAGDKPTNVETKVNSWPNSDYQQNVWSHTFTMPENALELFFLNINKDNIGFNAVIKIELAS